MPQHLLDKLKVGVAVQLLANQPLLQYRIHRAAEARQLSVAAQRVR
jgi:hypothetical protein